MPEATLKLVATLAGVAPTTVSRVVNGSENVAAETREKILAIIRDLDYTPNIHAANLRRKKLNDEITNDSKDRPVCANAPLRARWNSCLNLTCPQAAVSFSLEEYRAFVRQMVRLRRYLNNLKNHTERVQTCVDKMQETYSRRFSSGDAHHRVDIEFPSS